jgi:hypothetical protein
MLILFFLFRACIVGATGGIACINLFSRSKVALWIAACKSQSRLFWFLFLFFLLSLPFINPIVHGDGVGFYAYARAPLIQHNLHFEEDWRHAHLNFSQPRIGPDGQLLPEEYTQTGYVSNLHSTGPAILWMPFLLLAHFSVLFIRLFGAQTPANGFSFPYILAMAVGTAVYGFLGLLFSFSLARKYIDEWSAFFATVGVWFASSLPVYMYFNPAWSHAHSVFVVAFFIWYWDKTRKERTGGQWLLLGVLAGLMVDVYFPNGIFMLLPLIESLRGYAAALKSAVNKAMPLFGGNLLFGLALLVTVLPTLISRRIIFGGFLRFGPYLQYTWDWSAPHWREVLFSSDHGLFSWTPLLFLALCGLVMAPRAAREFSLYLIACSLAFYYVIASYPYWDGMSSFGNRFFISLTPIFVFGVAVFLNRIADLFSSVRVAKVACASVVACFILWNFGLIYQWGTHLIPVRGPISFREAAYNQFHVVPGQISSHLRSYFFRRDDLMQQIEQRDIEQLKKNAQP